MQPPFSSSRKRPSLKRLGLYVGVFNVGALSLAAGLLSGCKAGVADGNGAGGASTSTSTKAATTGTAGMGGSQATSSGSTTSGFATAASTTGNGGAGGGPIIDPCNNACGPVELCDEAHLGLDDNCNGLVDEGCTCTAGQAHFCFKGDPAKRNKPGCFDGTEGCTENGTWGPCLGGVHDAGDNCSANDLSACHAITAKPFSTVVLKTGTGNFSANAVAGSESYTVQCPVGVSQCPMVMAPSDFKPVQSGEYTVTYSKMVSGDPTPKTCTFPLVVGANGLRVELSWEHTTADSGVDLDLHVHEPNNSAPWGITPPSTHDCTWSDCVVDNFEFGGGPTWFSNTATPPMPVNWYDDPTPEGNTCYNDPRGVGAQWASVGMGCHNPRLDADDINCNAAVTDPDDPDFCTPENINIDYPPLDGKWTRIGVHYFDSAGLSYDVHPRVKVFCDGALAADLGPSGYYGGQGVVTFTPDEGNKGATTGNRFWFVADVAFTQDKCSAKHCVVQPLYDNDTTKTPVFRPASTALTSFGPPYPPPPM